MAEIIDLVGQRFGKLKVIELKGTNRWRSTLWLCHCDCGNMSIVSSGKLRSGKIKSCGCGHFGRFCSDETKKKRSEAAKKRWSDPEFKLRVSEKVGRTFKKVWASPGYKEKMSAVLKGRQSGEKNPMYGKKASKEHRKKLSESHIGIQAGEKHPMYRRMHTEESKKKMRDSHIGIPLTDDRKRNMSKSHKRLWEELTEEQKNQWIKNNRKNQRLRQYQTKPEKIMNLILNKLYPNEWLFVGDGRFVINGKIPDFININGQKKIIEVFGNYWHKGEDPKDREAIFEPFGYKTLVVWESELANEELAINKVMKFVEKI